ncbi:hypothetical protein ACIP8U_41365 [Streptomyces pseudovenezuelae]|uniref:hypothetical protein n=2 Tax=Streptomyces TaxID=1883 RepID=UPI0036EE1076
MPAVFSPAIGGGAVRCRHIRLTSAGQARFEDIIGATADTRFRQPCRGLSLGRPEPLLGLPEGGSVLLERFTLSFGEARRVLVARWSLLLASFRHHGNTSVQSCAELPS